MNHMTPATGQDYTRERRNYSTFRKCQASDKWTAGWKSLERKVRVEQMKLVELAQKNGSTNSPKVLKLQRRLALSLTFRRLAVQRVVSNAGGETAGVDKKLLTTLQDKWDMVEMLKGHIQNPERYQAQSVRGVFISKSNGKMRPLEIPTIEDRCLQALINLVVEPLVEMTSDRHSYGFRKYRSAKMAIGAVRKELGSTSEYFDKFVLDADIKGFFDKISHE